MAKKKKQKIEENTGFKYKKECAGIIVLVLSILGLGRKGIVGGIIKKFAIFLFGNWWAAFLILSVCLSLYLIGKREKPNYFTGRLIGVYSIIFAILLFSHINYVSSNNIKTNIITETYNNIAVAYDTDSEIRNTGGGMLGALFTFAFVPLFDIEGTYIVIIIIASFGLIMLFDLTLSDCISTIFSPFKRIFRKRETSDEDEENVLVKDITPSVKEPLKDNKVVITSVEDYLERKQEVQEEVKEPVVDTSADTSDTPYVKPSINLLNMPKSKGKVNSTEVIAANTKKLERVFNDFGMIAKVIEIHVGPAVTQYEMELQRGTKVNKVLSISREIALELSAKEVRIEAPIPGKSTVGIEIPNQTIIPVSMREIMEDLERNPKYKDSKLAAPLGRDIMGNVKCVEINKTPHMLVAGATGSGKSVCINNIILSVIMRATPDEVKMVLIDPKKVEFNAYEGIPHLLMPVVTDPKKASAALQKIVVEMDDRYETFKNSGTKNISTYNEYIEKQLKKNPDCGLKKMPFILVIIDELADLMLVASKEVEDSIMRITQMARAAGIHLIIATQRPSTDVITGVVKANIPSRISFAVSSSIDSRTILDMGGAEKLLGRGDMLFLPMGENAPERVQGAYVSDEELEKIVDYTVSQQKAMYDERFMDLTSSAKEQGNAGGGIKEVEEEYDDPLYNDIVEFVITQGKASASLLQRRFKLGYNRAARIVDLLEERGIIGPQNGSKPREVLVKLGSEEDDE